MEFTLLPEDEFEAFVSSHPLGNFLQSTAIGKRRSALGYPPYYVGVRSGDGTIIAAALLIFRPVLGTFRLFECLQGPVMNYDDEDLVTFFFARLRVFLRSNRGVRLRLNPPLLLCHRDKEGTRIDDGYDGARYVESFKRRGLIHLDNGTVDKNPVLLRWYAAKDMRPYKTEDDLMDGFDRKTRWTIRKTLALGVEVRTLPHDKLDEFYGILVHTGARRNFSIRDKRYYHDLVKYFGPERIRFCVAELNLDTYEAALETQLAAAAQACVDSRRACRQAPEYSQLTRRRERAEEDAARCRSKLSEAVRLRENGNVVTMAGALFVHYADELIYLSGGSYEQYLPFGAPYALQWHAQQYALKHQIPRYNFYGTKGLFSGNPEQEGVYRFKKSLGAVVEEQIGYFDLFPNKAYAALLTAAFIIRNHSSLTLRFARSTHKTGKSITPTKNEIPSGTSPFGLLGARTR